MYDENKLWKGHRIILPEMREKAVYRCGECRFFVKIQGVYENRWGCVVSIESFRKLWRRVPGKLVLSEVLNLAGKKGLEVILRRGNPEAQACGRFRSKLPYHRESTAGE